MKLPSVRSWKFWLLLLAVAFLGIQAVPVQRSNPPVEGALQAPAEVHAILKRSCYDCHSNETVWPWYSYVAPISWLVEHDVKDGRKHLNFSNWQQMTPRRRESKLRECRDEIEAGEMPLDIYVWIHPKAALSEGDRQTLGKWVEASLDEMK